MSSCEESDIGEERPGILDDALKDATATWKVQTIYHSYPSKISISILSNGKYVKIKLVQVNRSKKVIVFMTLKKYSLYQSSTDNLFSVIKAAVITITKDR